MDVIKHVKHGVIDEKIPGAKYIPKKGMIVFEEGLEDSYFDSGKKITSVSLAYYHNNNVSEIEVYTKNFFGSKVIKQRYEEHKGVIELFNDLSKLLKD